MLKRAILSERFEDQLEAAEWIREKMGFETDFRSSFESVMVVYEDYDIEKKAIEKDIL